MPDYFEKKQQEISVELIACWKRDEHKLMAQYGSRANYFLQEMAARLWADNTIRAEFTDFETLKAFLENEHRTAMHEGGLSSHKRPKTLDDDTSGADDATRAKWDADEAALKAEFCDYSTYAAYEKNRHRAKIYNR